MNNLTGGSLNLGMHNSKQTQLLHLKPMFALFIEAASATVNSVGCALCIVEAPNKQNCYNG